MTLSQELKSRLTEAVEQFYEGPFFSTEQARAHWHLAMDIREHVEPVPEPLANLEDETNMDVSGWLLDLPFRLAKHGMVDEAVTLGTRFAEITEAENFLGDRAVILAEAGRREDALAQLQENLLRFPEDPWVIIKGGDVYEQLGELEQAERLFWQGLELAGDDHYTRAGAVERLVPLLDKRGRTEEADALLEEEDAREAHRQQLWKDLLDEKTAAQPMALMREPAAGTFAEEDDFDVLSLPYTRSNPKIGRNDPCPCGSERKFKKCCMNKQ